MPDARHKIPLSVLVVIHTPAREVLLLRRTGAPEFWQSVTGSKDSPDESWQDCAVREVREETGIDALREGVLSDWYVENIYDIYPSYLHRYASGITRNTEHVLGLCVPAVRPVVLSAHEHVDFRWLPWHAAADACFSPSNAEAILMLPRMAG